MDLKKKLLNLIKNNQDSNPLLESNSKYAFALMECIKSGYISGLSYELNANKVPVFQKMETME